MIKVNIICVGKLQEKYLKDAVNEYSKRLSGLCSFSITEIPEYRLPDNPSQAEIDNALEKEGKQIAEKIANGSVIIAMCIEGKMLSSEQLANAISNYATNGFSSLCFIIGGSFGLSNEVKKTAHLQLSMSSMTFPHQLARVLLCEQIYRAFMINRGSKYHK